MYDDNEDEEEDEFFPQEYDAEDVFNTMIKPHMLTIANICDEYHIPMVASFQYKLEGDIMKICTSVVLPDNRVDERIVEAVKILTDPD